MSPYQNNRISDESDGTKYDGNCGHSSEMSREDLEALFPCEHPYNPSMADINQRLATYIGWPNHIKATTTELAEAGFICLNNGDKLKCFYCNGGLQHWKYDEDPFFEHAKWYPNCEYLLRKKGITYVQKTVEQFSNLTRPTYHPTLQRTAITNHITTSPPANLQTLESQSLCRQAFQSQSRSPQSVSSSSSALSARFSSCASSNTGILIAADSMSRSSSRSPFSSSRLSLAKKSEVVEEALKMAFDKDLVYRLVQKKLEQENEEYQSVLKLVEDLLSVESNPESNDDRMEVNYFEESSQALQSVYAPAPGPSSPSSSPSSSRSVDTTESITDTVALQNKIQDLKNEQICKVCLDRFSDCVFLPCGHVCCCVECGAALRKCPICRQTLEKIVKFYR